MPLILQVSGDSTIQGGDSHITIGITNSGPLDYPGGDNYRIQIGDGLWYDFGVLPPVRAGTSISQVLTGNFGLPAGNYLLCLGALSPDYIFSPERYYTPDYLHWTYPIQT